MNEQFFFYVIPEMSAIIKIRSSEQQWIVLHCFLRNYRFKSEVYLFINGVLFRFRWGKNIWFGCEPFMKQGY